MNIPPTNISIPVMASSVNPSTELAERDNRVREQIIAAKEVNQTDAETPVSLQERRERHASWNPSEHPTYGKRVKKKARKSVPSGENQITDMQDSVIAKRYQESAAPMIESDVDLNV